MRLPTQGGVVGQNCFDGDNLVEFEFGSALPKPLSEGCMVRMLPKSASGGSVTTLSAVSVYPMYSEKIKHSKHGGLKREPVLRLLKH